MNEDQQRWEGLFRGSVLSTAITKHISYITSSDTRAHGLILLNTALIPVALSGLHEERFMVAAKLCIIVAVVTICLCIFVLYPKRFTLHGKQKPNLLHYVSFSRMTEAEYMTSMRELLGNKEVLAEAAARDLFDLGKRIVAPRYAFLRAAYAVFLIGQLLAVLLALRG